jgi:hypothetical protein
LHGRTQELACFLRGRLGLKPPLEWQASLEPPSPADGCQPPARPAVFRRAFDGGYLAGVLAQEETFPSPTRLVLEGYRGYNLVLSRGRLYALEQTLSWACLDRFGEAELRHYQDRGRCSIGSSLAELKERVDQHAFDRDQARLRAADGLAAELQQARAQMGRTERSLSQAVHELKLVRTEIETLKAAAVRQAPLHVLVARLWRKGWRRFRAWAAARPRSAASRPAGNALAARVAAPVSARG